MKVQCVFLDEHGLKRSPLFCFTPSYWLSKPKGNLLLENIDGESNSNDNIEEIAEEYKDKNNCRIFDLHKTYKTKDGVVKSVNGLY